MGQADDNSYNLLDERWIPVLYTNGTYQKVGIRSVLKDAGAIRQIAASNPMDRVSLLRFLMAVLLWCRPDLNDDDRAMLNSADGIPGEWLKKLDENEAKFNLLGDGERFYQDSALKGEDPRPIADLLAEFPGADSVNHMRHVVHGTYGFCPACCALGILRLSVWASANKYYPASVNPGSAAYAIREKENLLLTLVANLPAASVAVGEAPWMSNVPPSSPGAVANLAWRPRKLWLNVGRDSGRCANCGNSDVLVESLCNEGGWKTPTTDGRTKKFWADDPHLLKEDEPISIPGLGVNAGAHSSRFWRDSLRLRGALSGKVVAIGPVVNKFTFQDATSVDVPNPSVRTRAGLSADCSKKLDALLKRTTPNPDLEHPEIRAALVLSTPDAETKIRASLDAPVATTDDGDFLRKIYEPMVEQVLASTVRGSPLRRRAATNDARHLLSKEIEKLVNSPNQPPASAAADGAAEKPNRARKKKGGAT